MLLLKELRKNGLPKRYAGPKERLRSSRSLEFDDSHVKAHLKEDGRQKTWESTRAYPAAARPTLNISKLWGFAQKFRACVPH